MSDAAAPVAAGLTTVPDTVQTAALGAMPVVVLAAGERVGRTLAVAAIAAVRS
jgi:hypothetical protein